MRIVWLKMHCISRRGRFEMCTCPWLVDEDCRVTVDPVPVSPPDGDFGGDAPQRAAQAKDRSFTRHGRQAVHEGGRSEGPDQEAQETELCQPQVCTGTAE